MPCGRILESVESWTRRIVVCATVAAIGFTPVVLAACALFCGPAMVHEAGAASAGHADPLATPAADEHAAHHASHVTPAVDASRLDIQTAAHAAPPQVAATGTHLSADECCPVVTAVLAEPARSHRNGVQGPSAAAVQPETVPALLTSSSLGQAHRPPRRTRLSVPALLPLRI